MAAPVPELLLEVGSPGLSGSAGVGISNADAEFLSGWGMCSHASGGAGIGGTGVLCGSIEYDDTNEAWAYSGAWSFYAGVTLTLPEAGASYSYVYTWVDRWIKWPWS